MARYVERGSVPGLVTAVSRRDGTNPGTGALEVYDEPRGGQWSRPPAFPSGGGGLVSTVDDYLAFGRMLLNWGRHRPSKR
jgi:CubicO group peptidase (beta-lactamase class C family)